MIFKAYDIRGIYGEQLNEDIAYKIGRAFAMYIGSKIVVAKDNRLSSDSLFEALTRGITDQGSDVYNIGLSTSPMFYFAVSNLVCDGGVIITASHNPPQYNGFKMVRSDAMPLSGEDGIDQIKQLVEENNFSSSKKGNISTLDITDKYVNSFEIKKYNLRVVVDTANSVSGLIVNRMFSGVSLFHLFSELDGSFPNHEPNPLEEKNIKDLKEKVLEHGADIGIAFDGDGDRVFFVDEKGELISSDLIIALIAKLIDKKVLYDLRCSNIIKETARDSVMWRVGHSFIKKKMKDEDIFFGGEYSGHYYLKQGSSYFESPYFVIYKLFEATENKKLSETLTVTRPTWNNQMLKELAKIVGEKVNEWCYDETPLEDCIEIAEKVLQWHSNDNGYEIAKEFEDEGFSPDSELVEILDGVSYDRSKVQETFIKMGC